MIAALRKHAGKVAGFAGDLALAAAVYVHVRTFRPVHNWSDRNQKLLKTLFKVGLVVGIALDLLLVLVLDRTSISETTWDLEEKHATLTTLVNLIFLLIGYLVRSDWRLAGLAFWLAGHLGGHF